MTDAELLREAITRSGLNAADFARQKLVRPPKSVYRWLNRENPIPRTVRDWLVSQVMPGGPITRARRKPARKLARKKAARRKAHA